MTWMRGITSSETSTFSHITHRMTNLRKATIDSTLASNDNFGDFLFVRCAGPWAYVCGKKQNMPARPTNPSPPKNATLRALISKSMAGVVRASCWWSGSGSAAAVSTDFVWRDALCASSLPVLPLLRTDPSALPVLSKLRLDRRLM